MVSKLLKIILFLAFTYNIVACEKVYDYFNSKPQVSKENSDTIFYGKYSQNMQDPTPIEWRILRKDGDRILVVSKYCLDSKPYNAKKENTTWEKSSLREWLNTVFLQLAFTKDEQRNIMSSWVVNEENEYYHVDGGNNTQDKIFLLSFKEANNYFEQNVERKCKLTNHAKENEAFDNNGYAIWWLRTPGARADHATNVFFLGDILPEGASVDYDNLGVRPALWLNLDAISKELKNKRH